MKNKMKLFCMLVSLILFTSAFAKSTSSLNLNFVNQSPRTGYAFLGRNLDRGPVVRRNGGVAHWQYDVTGNNKLILVGLVYASERGVFCAGNEGNLVLNTEQYKGDVITITFTKTDSDGGLDCTCTGSACDVSVVAKKSKM